MKKDIEIQGVPPADTADLVSCIPISGNRIASIDTNLRLRVWNRDSGLLLNEITVGASTHRALPFMAELQENMLMVVDAEAFSVSQINVPSGKVETLVQPHPEAKKYVSLPYVHAVGNCVIYILRKNMEDTGTEDNLFICHLNEQPWGKVQLKGLINSKHPPIFLSDDTFSILDDKGYVTSISFSKVQNNCEHHLVDGGKVTALTAFDSGSLLGAVSAENGNSLYHIQPFADANAYNFYKKYLDCIEIGNPVLISGLKRLEKTVIAIWGSDLTIHDTRSELKKVSVLLETKYGMQLSGTISKIDFAGDHIVFATDGRLLVCLNRKSWEIIYCHTESEVEALNIINNQIIFQTLSGGLFQTDFNLSAPTKLLGGVSRIAYDPRQGLLAWDKKSVHLFKSE